MVLGRFAYDTLRMHMARHTVCEKLHWASANLRKSQNLVESISTLLASCRAEIRRGLYVPAIPQQERAGAEPVLEEEMNQLSLREVTQENWRATLDLAVFPEQQRFIADSTPIAAIALAKAYIRPAGLIWVPYAFYVGTELVGFTELAYEPESVDNYWIFHFFIDHHFQGRGYGKEALRLFLQFIRDHHPRCQALHLTVHPENEHAQRLYLGVGFHPTGATLSDEPVYRLSFTS